MKKDCIKWYVFIIHSNQYTHTQILAINIEPNLATNNIKMEPKVSHQIPKQVANPTILYFRLEIYEFSFVRDTNVLFSTIIHTHQSIIIRSNFRKIVSFHSLTQETKLIEKVRFLNTSRINKSPFLIFNVRALKMRFTGKIHFSMRYIIYLHTHKRIQNMRKKAKKKYFKN